MTPMTAHPVVRFLLWVGLAWLALTGLMLVIGSISMGMVVAGVVMLLSAVAGAMALRRYRPGATSAATRSDPREAGG